MKIKKIIAGIVSVALVVGATVGSIYGYKIYQDKKTVIGVVPVSDINMGYYEDQETSYGMVTNDSAQEIYLDSNNQVEEVYVKVGDEVTIGEPLFKYDTRQAEIDIRRKALEISTMENDLAIAEHDLAELRKKTPVDKNANEKTSAYLELRIDEIEDKIDKLKELPQKDTKDANIYNYVTSTVVPFNYSTAAGTQSDPYIICCNQGAYVYGSFFNKLRNEWNGKYVKFVVVKKNSNGKMITTTGNASDSSETESSETGNSQTGSSETGSSENRQPDSSGATEIPNPSERPSIDRPVISPSQGTKKSGIVTTAYETKREIRYAVTTASSEQKKVTVPVADGSVSPNTVVYSSSNCPVPNSSGDIWYIFSGVRVNAELDQLKAQLAAIEKVQDGSDSYTATELAKEISEKESEVKTLNIKKQQEELKLESLQSVAANGVVYATVQGHVKSIEENENSSSGGNGNAAFMVVTSDDGLYVSGTVSELSLDTVVPGTLVTANSWESGQSFEAVITKVSDVPTQGNSWSDGNPNVSYYEYTAYIQDSSSLKNGEYVDLVIGGKSGENGEAIEEEEEETGGIYIEKAYVRQEDGKSYCMIADENNRLKKQYVLTGRTVWGTAIEIKAGLKEEDLIAFPYGKNVTEGVLVSEDVEM